MLFTALTLPFTDKMGIYAIIALEAVNWDAIFT